MKWSFGMCYALFIIIVGLLKYGDCDDCICRQCEIDLLPDNCTTIHGHIQIGLESQMPPFEIIEYKLENVTKIIGCLTIANSGFTSLQFLSQLEHIQYSQSGVAKTCSTYGNTMTIAKNSLLRRLYFGNLKRVVQAKSAEYGIYIVDNPSLCITEQELELFLNTTKFYAPHISICNSTKNYCKLDDMNFFDSGNIPEGCQVLTDSLVLNGSHANASVAFQNRLNDIEQILGSIIIISSDITSLIMPKLWRIYNFQPTLPVILLQKNPNLTKIEFVSLKSIPYFGSYPQVVYAFQNPKLVDISETTCKQFASLGKTSFDDSNPVCRKNAVQNTTNIISTTTPKTIISVENVTTNTNSTILPTPAAMANGISEGSNISQVEQNKPSTSTGTKDSNNCCGYELVSISFVIFVCFNFSFD